MSEFLEVLIVGLGGFGVLVAALAWLGKSLISHLLSKDLEGHKHRVESLYEKNLEAYRHELEKIQKEHEVRFAALHEKRMEVIAELYSLLRELAEVSLSASAAGIFPFPEGFGKAELAEILKTGLRRLEAIKQFMDKNRLYFSEALADKIDRFIEKIHGPIERASSAVQEDYSKATQELRSLPPLSEAIFSLRRDIEQEFRKLLGS